MSNTRISSAKLMWLTIPLLCALVGIGCGGSANSGTGGGGQPPPSITLRTLDPNYLVAGTGNTNISVIGSGFTKSSVVHWNGNPLPTTFGSSGILNALISSSLLAAPGKVQIAVQDGPQTSKSLVLGIASPAASTAGVIGIVTVAADGSPANGDSLVAASISATGRYVAFQSGATNLVSGPSSGFQEIYERDTCVAAPAGCTPTTVRITATFSGSPVNGHSRASGISADGRYVVFESSATNILPNSEDCSPSAGLACVFLRDTCTGTSSGCIPNTTAISVDTNGMIVRGGGTAITPDGRFVVFGSIAPNIAAGETNGIGDIYLRDTCNGTSSGCSPSTTLISLSFNGNARDGFSGPSATSGTGRYVAFQSWATNIVANETEVPGNFWRDTCIGATASCSPSTLRVDVTANGDQPNNPIFIGPSPAITADGRLVAFSSTATDLVSTDVQGHSNAYVRDTCTGAPSSCAPTTKLVSLANDGSVGNCGSPSQGLSMTPDGRFVAFDSIATNLTPDDNFPACSFEDVFVRDTCYGASAGCVPSTVRVSVTNTPNPQTPGFAISGLPAISADGHYVVFLSAAANLAPGVTGNGHTMVYIAKTGF